jgi:uncharacterized membrane protein
MALVILQRNLLMTIPTSSITLTSARVLAWLYGLIVDAAGLCAWVVDIRLLHDHGEHMLPDMIFLVTALPLSFTLGWAYDLLPSLSNSQFAQLIYTTLCAAVQAGLLWRLVHWLGAHPVRRRHDDH